MDLLELQKWSYLPEIPDDIYAIRKLLQDYARIPAAEVDGHLLRIREEAWNLARQPFIGRWKFLDLIEPDDPCYQQALFRLKLPRSNDALLDLGCGMGQALRQFRSDGVKGSLLTGLDLDPGFVDLGYELFRDKHELGAAFVMGDVTDPGDTDRLSPLEGRVTMVHARSFFHLFTWTQQLYIAKRIVSFLKPGTGNAMIFGREAGTLASKPRDSTSDGPLSAYLHDQQSLQDLWDTVGTMTNTRWAVRVEADGDPLITRMPGVDKDTIPIKFIVHQIPHSR